MGKNFLKSIFGEADCLRGLTETELEGLIPLISYESYTEKSVIFEEEKGPDLYLVLRGYISHWGEPNPNPNPDPNPDPNPNPNPNPSWLFPLSEWLRTSSPTQAKFPPSL